MRRAATIVGGSALLVVGAVMLVAPGPGILAALLGLTLLAREYRWARKGLVQVRRRARQAAGRLRARRARKAAGERPPRAAGPGSREMAAGFARKRVSSHPGTSLRGPERPEHRA